MPTPTYISFGDESNKNNDSENNDNQAIFDELNAESPDNKPKIKNRFNTARSNERLSHAQPMSVGLVKMQTEQKQGIDGIIGRQSHGAGSMTLRDI